LANTLTGRILATTSPGGTDDDLNLDPTPGENRANALRRDRFKPRYAQNF
jgi:hypothetical protein